MKNIISLQEKTKNSLLLKGAVIAMSFGLLIGVHSAKAAITSQLDLGSGGSDVVELQTYLAANPSLYPSGLITGRFDLPTQIATKKFQTAQGIISSGTPETTGYGRVGPQTMVRLNTLLNFFSTLTTKSDSKMPIEKNITSLEQKLATSGLPVSLEIPKIKVYSSIEYKGVNDQGLMDMTKSLDNVVWYDLGERPGEIGSAVLAGHHNGNGNGQASVFDNLFKLKKGDKIYVKDDQGKIISFIVTKLQRYNPDADASDIFDSNDGISHLNLITCDGTFDKISKKYLKRLVVFTDKEWGGNI